MKTFNVLEGKEPLSGSYFLEASAGTGKTFAIENIIPRLLLQSSSLSLEQILVVTFTRAATRELRSRIHKNLIHVLWDLEGREGKFPYLEEIRAQGKEALYQAKKKIEAAVYSFEQAQIFTLHGFCLKILQEFSFETQFFVEESQEEVGRDARLYSYIADFFRTGLTKDFFSKTQMKKVFRKKDIQSLCKEIFSCLEGGKKVRIYPTASSRWKQWNHELSLVANVSKEMLWEEFSLVAPRLAKSAKRKEEADLFFSLIERRESSFEEWDRLLENEEFFLSNIAFTKEEGSGLLRSLQETFVPLYEEALDEDVLFLQLAGACFAHYEKGKEALVSFTPDELVMQLRSCLKKASFRKKVQDKYLVAIIDEFQDTDPLQWDLFETLFLQEPREGFSIYLVGDPKQSIYAFRSADVYTYLKACSLLGEQARAYLDTNFRSHPKLV